jgi:hypothetical protein
MSLLSLMADADKAMAIKHWGTKIKENGTLKDTGVQEFVEELIRLLASEEPITLNRPVEFRNKTNGPGIIMYNEGPNTDWIGYRVQDAAGNVTDLGIGLGSSGVNANSFIPDPHFAIDPDDMHRYHSDLGGNAGGDKDHPKAVEAGNGLLAPTGLIGNFQVPIWILNLLKQPKYQEDDCHPRYRVGWFDQPVYWPTYVPQSEILLAVATERIAQESLGEVTTTVGGVTMEVYNRMFVCVESGDDVYIACISGQWEIVSAMEYRLFAMGETVECIAKGGSGDVTVDGDTVTASSPFDTVDEGVSVALTRASGCDGWTITARECPSSAACP